jgi:predicted Ser/Thr protein kinase
MPAPEFSRFGKYEIEAELGRGGFGRVFRAFDPAVGRLVAIKILVAEAGSDLLTRFRNEAMATGKLRHENIVTIYEFGEDKGIPFIAMEYLEGEDLHQAIASGKPMSLLEKISIMAQAAAGLDCAHRHGIVHRDIKPANIRLLTDGTVKIMDFGIARLIQEAGGARLTQPGHVLGTLRYMAPEQVMGHDADARADIFAYGVTFYELVTGRHPFEAPDPWSVFQRITNEDPEPIDQLMPGCPEKLAQVIRRALCKNRELRYQTLQDLRADIEPLTIELRSERAGLQELLAEKERAALLQQLDLEVAAHLEKREFDQALETLDRVYVKLPGEPELARLLESALSAKAMWEKHEAIKAADRTVADNLGDEMPASSPTRLGEIAKSVVHPLPSGPPRRFSKKVVLTGCVLAVVALAIAVRMLRPAFVKTNAGAPVAIDRAPDKQPDGRRVVMPPKSRTASVETPKQGDRSSLERPAEKIQKGEPNRTGVIPSRASEVPAVLMEGSPPGTVKTDDRSLTMDALPQSTLPQPPPLPVKKVEPVPANTAHEQIAADRGEISKVFTVYAAAFEKKDLKLLRTVWPALPETVLAQAFRASDKIRSQLRPLAPAELTGDRAVVRCTRVIEQVTQFGRQRPVEEPRTVHLRKENGRWLISAID